MEKETLEQITTRVFDYLATEGLAVTKEQAEHIARLSLAFSKNYVADKNALPNEVTFANGRKVWIVKDFGHGKPFYYLDVGYENEVSHNKSTDNQYQVALEALVKISTGRGKAKSGRIRYYTSYDSLKDIASVALATIETALNQTKTEVTHG